MNRQWLMMTASFVASLGVGCGSEVSDGSVIGVPASGTPAAPVATPGGPAVPGVAPVVVPPGNGNPPTPVVGPVAAPPPGPVAGAPPALPPAGPAPTQMDPDCGAMGLQLDGLMYSPGGNVLPHACEPFHQTDNNPYAIKCVEAWSWYQTQFPGDEFCILPPPPGQGVQFGVHPQEAGWYAAVSTGDMSGYEGVAAGYLMDPGTEEERNIRVAAPTNTDLNYYRVNTRMRAGSHHMIVAGVQPGANPVGAWTPGNATEGLFGGTSLPGAQRPDENIPQSLEKPPEDEGLFRTLPANREIVYDMHHFNATDKTTLKEAWQNLWLEEDARTRIHPIFGMPISQAAATFATPGEVVDQHYSWAAQPSDLRLIEGFGHRHAWTPLFTAWIEKPDGSTEILYQSFDWYDMPTYRYDSVTDNPPVNTAAKMDGAVSGIRVIKQGEELHFNCHMRFTDERAQQTGNPNSPSSLGRLRFANQAFRGEMCILFGNTVGRNIGTPAVDPAPVPDFARM